MRSFFPTFRYTSCVCHARLDAANRVSVLMPDTQHVARRTLPVARQNHLERDRDTRLITWSSDRQRQPTRSSNDHRNTQTNVFASRLFFQHNRRRASGPHRCVHGSTRPQPPTAWRKAHSGASIVAITRPSPLLHGLLTAPAMHSVERYRRATTTTRVRRRLAFGRLESLFVSKAAYPIVHMQILVLLRVAHFVFPQKGRNRGT